VISHGLLFAKNAQKRESCGISHTSSMLPDVTESLYPIWLEKVEAELKKCYSMFDTCHVVLMLSQFQSCKYLMTTQKQIRIVFM
jgi:hypothetical protein